MDAYDPELVPEPFGLANGGAACDRTSLLQLLASCPAFVRAAAAAPRAKCGSSSSAG